MTSSQGPRTHSNPFEQLKALLSHKRLRDPFDMSEDHLRSIQMVRRAREEVFGGGLFSDPAWDILLELYAAHLGQRTVSINDLAAEIRLPPGNVSRWVAVLSEKEIVETIGMDGDPVRLTSYGAAGMGRLAGHWGSAFLSI